VEGFLCWGRFCLGFGRHDFCILDG
jgi:hypothetical protein